MTLWKTVLLIILLNTANRNTEILILSILKPWWIQTFFVVINSSRRRRWRQMLLSTPRTPLSYSSCHVTTMRQINLIVEHCQATINVRSVRIRRPAVTLQGSLFAERRIIKVNGKAQYGARSSSFFHTLPPEGIVMIFFAFSTSWKSTGTSTVDD